jgi:hypothetical protein
MSDASPNRWRARLRATVRRLVVRTSVPPVLGFYRFLYRLALRTTVGFLGRYPAVKAVYVRRPACQWGLD